MCVACPTPMYIRPSPIDASTAPLSSRLPANWDFDIAVIVPADFDGNFAVVDGLLAHVVSRAVVDLAIRPLVDAENHHQPAALLKQPARHPLAPERELLALARLEQVTMNAVSRVAGAEFIGGNSPAKKTPDRPGLGKKQCQIHRPPIDIGNQP